MKTCVGFGWRVLCFGPAALAVITGCSLGASPDPVAPSPCIQPESPSSTGEGARRRWQADNSEIVQLSSTQTGRDYDLIVGLPPSFYEQPERRYPTVYITDGQWDFSLVNMLSGGLRYDKQVPEFLVVAITYAGAEPDYDKLRREDYTPTRFTADGATSASGGDADKFLAFMEEGIIPLIEQRYRADPASRVLAGHSLGGLFALYALFQKPELFDTVLSLSPAVGWDERVIFAQERKFQQTHPLLSKRVWVSVGDSEWPHFTQAAREFIAQFSSSNYQQLTLKTRIVEGEAHSGVKPESYNRALRFAFQPWADALAPNK